MSHKKSDGYIFEYANRFEKVMKGKSLYQHYINNYLAIFVGRPSQKTRVLPILKTCYELIESKDQKFYTYLKTQYEKGNNGSLKVIEGYINKKLVNN